MSAGFISDDGLVLQPDATDANPFIPVTAQDMLRLTRERDDALKLVAELRRTLVARCDRNHIWGRTPAGLQCIWCATPNPEEKP